MKKLIIIPDTNFYIHFQNIDEICWSDVLDDKYKEIKALVIPPVLTELDNHKFSDRKKLRDRATKVTKLIEKSLLHEEGTPLKNDVILELLEPECDFVDLDTKNMDDRIINFCKYVFDNLNDDQNLIVVTHDTGLKLKLKKNKICFLDLGEKYKLRLEKSKEQIELDKVRGELGNFKNRLPKLLLFGDLEKKNVIEFTIDSPNELSRDEIDQEVFKIKEEVPLRVSDDSNIFKALESINMHVNTIQEKDWDNYNAKVEKFHESWGEFYKNKNKYNNFKKLVMPLDLILVNQGTLPGKNTDIDLHITVSKAVKLLNGYEYEDMLEELYPNEPSRPQKPKTLLESIGEMSNWHHNMAHPNLFTPDMISHEPINVSSPNITPTNSYNVSINVKNIKHHTDVKLDTMYLIFPNHSYSDSFKIEYKILCDELPEPQHGIISYINRSI